jgi:antitoxin component YwqK of YwqJK toxin-antitoxin module
MRFKIITICLILSGLTGYSQLLEAQNLHPEKAYGKNDIEGRKTGLWTFYRKDKSLSAKIHFFNGKREGMTKYYWENGNLYKSANYINGKKEGVEKSYSNNGSVLYNKNYKEDVLHGTTISYYNGEIDEFVTYKNGIKHGKFQDYYKGTINYEGVYQNGKTHGLWLERFVFDDERNGKVSSEYKMINGKLVNPVKFYEYDDFGLYSDTPEIKRYYWLGDLDLPKSDIFYFFDDAKRGEWNMYDENNILIQRKTYNNTGDVVANRIFNKKGIVIEFEEDYKNGKSYKRNEYYDNGALESVRIIDPTDEYRTIMSKNYYEDGNTKSYYENNIRTYYYKSGKIKAKKEFNYGKGKDSQISSTTEFYENGNIKVVKKYTGLNDQGSGIKDGAWKYYNEKGELIKTENYSNGIKQ